MLNRVIIRTKVLKSLWSNCFLRELMFPSPALDIIFVVWNHFSFILHDIASCFIKSSMGATSSEKIISETCPRCIFSLPTELLLKYSNLQ